MVLSFLRGNGKRQRRQSKGRRWEVAVSTPELLEVRQLLTGGSGATGVLPVLMVIADTRDFYYQEYGDTRTGLEAEGIEVQVASRTTNPSTSHPGTGEPSGSGGVVIPDIALADVNPDDYSAIVFVGGWGSSMYQYAFSGDYYDDLYDGDVATTTIANNLITTFLEQDKYVTAICHGVTVLAWARVDGESPLNGKQVSVPFIGSPGVYYNGQSYGYYQLGQYEQATDNGAIANTASGQYGNPETVTDDVVVDGKIITAENYDAALAFGHRIGQEVYAAAGITPTPPKMNVGVNLEGNFDWSSAWVFRDAFLRARPWGVQAHDPIGGNTMWQFQAGNGPELSVDSDGWVTELQTWIGNGGVEYQQRATTVIFAGEAQQPAGTYRAEWDGNGVLAMPYVVEQGVTPEGRNYALVNMPAGVLFGMTIESTDPANPIRNINFWMPDYQGESLVEDDWTPGSTESPFHPLFLQRVDDFDTLRFMDWQMTNFSDVVTWNDRRTLSDASQSDGDLIEYELTNGVALEYMIELSNEVDANPWFNMPYQADDDFVYNFATMVRDTLDPELKIYVEWSNEIWNSAFPVNSWIYDQVALPENAGLDFFDVAGNEIQRDFDIWTTVFAGQEDRLVRVVAGQQANSWILGQLLENVDGRVDAVSASAYAGIGYEASAAFTAESTPDDIMDYLENVSIPWALDRLQEHRQVANTYEQLLGKDLPLLTYESGSHVISNPSAFPGSVAEAQAIEAMNSPRMYDIYQQLLHGARDAGVDLYNEFTFTSGSDPNFFGNYGLLKQMDQPLEDSPQYQALLDFIFSQQEPPHVNAAPVLTVSGTAYLDSISANLPAGLNQGTLVTDLLNRMGPEGGVVDEDIGDGKGIAINGLSGTATGTWQFTIDGGTTWQNIGPASNDTARLLASNPDTRIRYLPNVGFKGEVRLAFVAWDQTEGINGGLGVTKSRGGTSTFSANYDLASLNVTNIAPVLNASGNPMLDGILMNVTNNPGTLITDLIARMSPAGSITDVDPASLQGIAINGLSGTADGTWEYTVNGGTNWAPIGTTGNSNARLLAADGNTRIRFVPNSGFKGEVRIAFVAWDRSSGANGGVANVAARGGSTAFSVTYELAGLIVSNSAPVLTPTGNATLDPIPMNVPNGQNPGTTITALIECIGPAGSITDANPGTIPGIAINGLGGTSTGTWQYSIDGGTSWSSIGTTGNSNARLLASNANTRIRYVPNAGFTGLVKLAFVAWDQSSGVNGGITNVATRGSTTPFSTLYDYASLIVG